MIATLGRLLKDSPGAEKEANWLPVRELFLILRTYLAGKDLLSPTWAPPPVLCSKAFAPELSSGRYALRLETLGFGSAQRWAYELGISASSSPGSLQL